MKPEQIEKERAAFEAWASKGRSITHDGTQYSDDITEGMWQGQIIRAEISALRENESNLSGLRQGWEYGLNVEDEEYMIRKQELQNTITALKKTVDTKQAV